MKCPNCGAEMAEGLLYCEHCGEDIHMVPDFEPELEQNMEESLQDMLRVVAPPLKQTVREQDDPAGKKAKSDRWKLIAGWGALGIFVLIVVMVGVKIFQFYSVDYQTKRAVQATNRAQYEKAIRYYERAMELAPTDVALKLDLAQVYFLMNDKDNYEYWLREIAEDPRTETEQLESIYGKLIAIYRAKEDYQTIHDMLVQCQDESIRSTYRVYISEMPQFSVPAGDYSEVKALKLTGSGKGKIYYTLDGQTPDESKTLYRSPILMEDGDYTVKAVYINENNIRSQVAEAQYHISVTELGAPELNLDDGEYDSPMVLAVTNDPENIYYTTNGTIPTLNSNKYTEPIPLQAGQNRFCFARLEEGKSSVTVERTITLSLRTDLTPDAVLKLVRESALESGRIYDLSGHFDESASYYIFQYLYPTTLDNGEEVYLIAEVLADGAGGIVRTGNYYAVDIYTGTIKIIVM